MAVDNAPIKIDPYQSTVPLVQMPVEQNAGLPADPVKGNVSKKGTGALMIGDALIKGFMQGHAIKAQRQYETAKATIGAAQAGEEAAWNSYQQKLSTGEATKDPSDPNYQAYQQAHQRATETMAKFVLPEKGQKNKAGKNESSSNKTKEKASTPQDAAKPQSFGEKIKDFLSANPHIVPQIALMSRNPNPPGMTPQTEAQKLAFTGAKREDAEAQQKIDDRNVVSAGRAMFKDMTPEQEKTARAAMPEADRKKLEEAESRFEMESPKGAKQITWTDGKGSFIQLREDQNPPAGYYPWPKPSLAGQPKGEESFVAEYAQQNGIDPQKMPAATRKYLHDVWTYRNPTSTATSSGSTTDKHGNRVNTSTSNRTSKEPAPLSGVTAVGAQSQGGESKSDETPKGKMTALPAKPIAGVKTSATGKMQPPPAQTAPAGKGKMTLTDRQRFDKMDAKHQAGWTKAYKEYTDKLTKANAIPDETARNAARKDAQDQYEAKGREIEADFHKGEKKPESNLTVTVPGGKTYTFKDQASADAFRKEAGI